MSYKIFDWTGKICFDGKEFNTFEDGEEYLSEILADTYETDRQEYYIEQSN